jgi:ferredoxin
VIEETPFTVADFVLCDPRYAAHFARVPRERWNALMLPADEWLAREPKSVGDAVPFVLAIDTLDRLQRVIVDARMMQMVARCRTFWHRLQEQGGVHNSHAEILLAREKAKWELAKAGELDALKASVGTAAATSVADSGAAAAADASATPAADTAAAATASEPALPARNPDEAWIDTARCPSCNECQTINDKMFKYNENKQAYIADVRAGTFRQMVEAAEVCQVSIIHPGKPLNPNEPGLPELLERAATFQ